MRAFFCCRDLRNLRQPEPEGGEVRLHNQRCGQDPFGRGDRPHKSAETSARHLGRKGIVSIDELREQVESVRELIGLGYALLEVEACP